MKSLLLALFILSASTVARADNCKTLVDKSEAASGSNPSTAERVAKAAIVACTQEHQKTARPYMVLAVVANNQKRFQDVIKWSEQALSQEPGLPLAYMDMCSAYLQMKQYDQAVDTCKKGLLKKSEWSAKLNFNIGLALFQKSVDQSKFSDTLAAEPYFKESKRLDPSIAQNDFYLGTIEENVKSNAKAAVPLYQAACKKGSKPACDSLVRATKTAAAPPTNEPRQVRAAVQNGSAVSEPASLEEEKLWDLFEDAYRKKGLDAAAAKSNVGAIRKGMSQVPAAQRVQALQTMLKQMQ